MKISESLGHKLIVSLVVGSILSVCGVIYGALIIIPRIEERLDNKVELLQQADAAIKEEGEDNLEAERKRSTVIDDYSTKWLKATSDRSLSNTERIKGLETAVNIHRRNHE